MKIHEYQAKGFLREFGVPVPNGDVADTPAMADNFDPIVWLLRKFRGQKKPSA